MCHALVSHRTPAQMTVALDSRVRRAVGGSRTSRRERPWVRQRPYRRCCRACHRGVAARKRIAVTLSVVPTGRSEFMGELTGLRTRRFVPGMEVEVRTRYLRNWTAGFDVTRVTEHHVELRRRSDGAVLPLWFLPDDLRPSARSGPS
jgi:hypothetical protein